MTTRTLPAMFAFAALAAAAAAQAPPKRAIAHADYDIWNTTTGVTLSRDGKWMAVGGSPSRAHRAWARP